MSVIATILRAQLEDMICRSAGMLTQRGRRLRGSRDISLTTQHLIGYNGNLETKDRTTEPEIE